MKRFLAKDSRDVGRSSIRGDMKRIMGLTRYAVFVPAIASIIGALLLMAQGSWAMLMAVIDSVSNGYGLKETIVEVLTAVDAHGVIGYWIWTLRVIY
jgi:uncharacterized membrane protein YqhA